MSGRVQRGSVLIVLRAGVHLWYSEVVYVLCEYFCSHVQLYVCECSEVWHEGTAAMCIIWSMMFISQYEYSCSSRCALRMSVARRRSSRPPRSCGPARIADAER